MTGNALADAEFVAVEAHGPLGARARPLLLAVLFWIACLGILPITGSVGAMLPGDVRLAATGLSSLLYLLLLTWIFARLFRQPLTSLGIAPDRKSWVRILAGFAFGLLIVAIYFAIVAPITGARWAWNDELPIAIIAMALALNLLGAAAEEVAFRGYPLRTLFKAYGLWPAQILVAIPFVLYHIFIAGWPVPNAVVGTGIGSLLFGMAAIATRGLAVPIGVHAAWNFGMWAMGTREPPAPFQITRIDWSRAATVNVIAYLVAAAGGIIFFYHLYRRACRLGESGQ